MPLYNSVEHSDNYSKTSGNVWYYHKDEPVLTDDAAIVYFTGNNASDWFNPNEKMTGQRSKTSTKDVEIMMPWKYLSNI